MKSKKSKKHHKRGDFPVWVVFNGAALELWFGITLHSGTCAISIPLAEWPSHRVDQRLEIGRRLPSNTSGDVDRLTDRWIDAAAEILCVAGGGNLYDVEIDTKNARVCVVADSPEDAERAARRHVHAGAVSLQFTAWPIRDVK